jgi:spermidine/putrescine-binding protein
MTISMQQQGKGALTIDITGVASADAGGQGALANPEGVSIMILRTTLYIRATKATDILNDLAMGGVAAGEVYNGHAMQNTAKTGITAPALWTTDKFLTFTGSASLVGMDASLYIEYLRV